MFVATLSDGPVVAVEPGATPFTRALSLSHPTPNPTSSRVELRLVSRDSQYGRVEVYDMLGRRVAVPYNGTLEAGVPRPIEVDVSGLRPGVYVLRVTAASGTAMRVFTVTR
ncbi:MAG: T9SS type A sorting domain-containing protein [Rhodothermaceae bacterium]|nr:T9SS type A sorting domain-containing protein [Rhodothermaceae bacterium]